MKVDLTDSLVKRLLALGFCYKQGINKIELEKLVTEILSQVAKDNLGYLLTSDDPRLRTLADLYENKAVTKNFFSKYKHMLREKSRQRARRRRFQCGIGLTGGISTGKSTIGSILRSLGATVIDADQLSRDVVDPAKSITGWKTLNTIVNTFGRDVLLAEERLDRAKLRKIIFNDKKKRKQLEKIMHPAIESQLFSQLDKRSNVSTWFYESALLYETGYAEELSQVWVASCSEEVQIKRLMHRDSCSEEEAKQAISIQMPMSEKVNKADLVIDTEVDLEDLSEKVEEYLSKVSK